MELEDLTTFWLNEHGVCFKPPHGSCFSFTAAVPKPRTLHKGIGQRCGVEVRASSSIGVHSWWQPWCWSCILHRSTRRLLRHGHGYARAKSPGCLELFEVKRKYLGQLVLIEQVCTWRREARELSPGTTQYT
uniref:Uncharacterized protein n=1 Tax=Physcomitrium patens TaxID=3218 RepID=A0A7I4FA07_PHYPA